MTEGTEETFEEKRHQGFGVPHKLQAQVVQIEPDGTRTLIAIDEGYWEEADGTRVTDPARIEWLETNYGSGKEKKD